jgi:hypothetical protein
MNERIKELADEATIKTSHKYHTWGDRIATETTEVFDKEKFAELIVRECANILMKPEYAMNHPEELGDYNKGWVNGRLLGIEHIKEHFGVEE